MADAPAGGVLFNHRPASNSTTGAIASRKAALTLT